MEQEEKVKQYFEEKNEKSKDLKGGIKII